jgi:DNA-binding protein H-NS
MKNADLKSLSVDQLWDLREQIAVELGRKIAAEKAALEERLRRLGNVAVPEQGRNRRAKRPYPKVLPKYRNPKNRDETWAGRGKQPRWLVAQLRTGRKLDDFLIRRAS